MSDTQAGDRREERQAEAEDMLPATLSSGNFICRGDLVRAEACCSEAAGGDNSIGVP